MSAALEQSPESGVSQQQITRAERVLALLLGYSKLLFLLLVAAFVIASWTDFRALLPRISRFEALGIKVEVSELVLALRKQAESVDAPYVELQPGQVEAVLARALKVQPVFEGATILWIDDEPANNLPFRQLLRSLGAGVEAARSTGEALALAARDRFDLVVSDIRRKNEGGVDGIAQLRASGVTCPAVFYVLQLDPTQPVPQGALGITNRPDELLNLVIDGLERSRWSNVRQAAFQPAQPAREEGDAPSLTQHAGRLEAKP